MIHVRRLHRSQLCPFEKLTMINLVGALHVGEYGIYCRAATENYRDPNNEATRLPFLRKGTDVAVVHRRYHQPSSDIGVSRIRSCILWGETLSGSHFALHSGYLFQLRQSSVSQCSTTRSRFGAGTSVAHVIDGGAIKWLKKTLSPQRTRQLKCHQFRSLLPFNTHQGVLPCIP